MDTGSYSKKNVRIAGVIAALSILFGLGGYWLTHEYAYISIAFIVMGVGFIGFSHDLTMQRVIKYQQHNLSYKFGRIGYIVVGVVFIVASILMLLNH